MFITAKMGRGPYQSKSLALGANEVGEQLTETLSLLNTTYIDLFLIHWPCSSGASTDSHCKVTSDDSFRASCRLSTWKAMLDEFDAGRALAVGVSNYELNHLEELESSGLRMPAVNQYEFHPYWQQNDVLEYCNAHSIVFNGYSPLGAPDHTQGQWSNTLLEDNAVRSVAKETGRTMGEVLLRYSYEKGVLVNPRTVSSSHMTEALTGMFEFKLSSVQVATLDALGEKRAKNCEEPHDVCMEPD